MTTDGKVLWHLAMSLDGFIASTDNSMDWLAGVSNADENLTENSVSNLGAIITGRRAFDYGVANHEDPSRVAYGGAFTGPVFVLTHHPEDATPVDGITFLNGDLAEAIRTCLDAADGKDVEIFSADIARQCLERGGLIDEFRVHLVPVMLGAGLRLLDLPGIEPVRWELIHDGPPNQTVDLRYRAAAE